MEYRIALADTAYISHKLGTKILVTNDAKNLVQIIFLFIYDIFFAFCCKNIVIQKKIIKKIVDFCKSGKHVHTYKYISIDIESILIADYSKNCIIKKK